MLFFSIISVILYFLLYYSLRIFFSSLFSPTPSYCLSSSLDSGLRERSSEDCLICCLRHHVKGSKQVHLIETDTHTTAAPNHPLHTHLVGCLLCGISLQQNYQPPHSTHDGAGIYWMMRAVCQAWWARKHHYCPVCRCVSTRHPTVSLWL